MIFLLVQRLTIRVMRHTQANCVRYKYCHRVGTGLKPLKIELADAHNKHPPGLRSIRNFFFGCGWN